MCPLPSLKEKTWLPLLSLYPQWSPLSWIWCLSFPGVSFILVLHTWVSPNKVSPCFTHFLFCPPGIYSHPLAFFHMKFSYTFLKIHINVTYRMYHSAPFFGFCSALCFRDVSVLIPISLIPISLLYSVPFHDNIAYWSVFLAADGGLGK